MEDKVGLLVLRIFFSLCALLSLSCVIRPESWLNRTIKWEKWSLKLFGFESEIKPTPRARTILQIWNFIMFCIFVIALISLPRILK